MFAALYFYRVSKKNIVQFLDVQRKSALIYKKHGAIEDWTFEPRNLQERYGCTTFPKEIMLAPDEDLFFSISLFESQAAHERTMARVDEDPEIGLLYKEICESLDISRVIRGEFNRLV